MPFGCCRSNCAFQRIGDSVDDLQYMKVFFTPRPIISFAHRLPYVPAPTMSRPYNRNNQGGRPRRDNRNDNPTVALSKALSWLLRHNLDKSGLEARSDGYVRLDALVPS